MLQILPERRFSYVVDENGEPMVVFYKNDANVFVNQPDGSERKGYFLNIRKPALIDVAGLSNFTLPLIPDGCDGIILENYGPMGAKAFIVKNLNAQTMEIPL